MTCPPTTPPSFDAVLGVVAKSCRRKTLFLNVEQKTVFAAAGAEVRSQEAQAAECVKAGGERSSGGVDHRDVSESRLRQPFVVVATDGL